MAEIPTVLVIDDVEATRSGLAQLLRLRGYRTREAANGAEGLRILREDPQVCAVILDLMMPESSGYWFRERQLTEPALARIPVIVFTGVAGTTQQLCATLQVSEVLLKPISVDRVFEAVSRCCGLPPARTEP